MVHDVRNERHSRRTSSSRALRKANWCASRPGVYKASAHRCTFLSSPSHRRTTPADSTRETLQDVRPPLHPVHLRSSCGRHPLGRTPAGHRDGDLDCAGLNCHHGQPVQHRLHLMLQHRRSGEFYLFILHTFLHLLTFFCLYQAGSAEANFLAGLLDIVLGPVTGLLGFGCSPISVVGLGSGNGCSAHPVCCENNSIVCILFISTRYLCLTTNPLPGRPYQHRLHSHHFVDCSVAKYAY